MAVPRHFRHTGLVLVRASTDPGGLCLPRLDLHSADGAETLGRAWLAQMWDRDAFRLALKVASPALCEQISAALSGAAFGRRQWRRLLVSVCSYVLRWQNRATPFGLFAGITTATISPTTRVKFGENHSMHVRVDPAWLDELISGLELDPAVLAELSVVVNNAGFSRGDRFVVPKQLPSTLTGASESADQIAADLGAVELALRRTRPVAAALAAAKEPIRGQELVARLEREFPTASPEQITTMLVGLVANHVLITNLRAPATSTDPLGHLLDQLDIVNRRNSRAEHDPGLERVAEARDALGSLHNQIFADDRQPAEVASRFASNVDRSTTAAGCRAADGTGGGSPSSLPTTPPRLAVDTAVDGQLDLPESVLQEAEAAASVLLRLTRSPFGTAAWRDYHVRFRERYGAGAVVPVRELVSDAGLGYPVGFLGAAREQPVRALTDRDAALQALVQETVLDRRTEIVLSETMIDQLAVGDHTDLLPPDRAELAFTVHTASMDSLRRGRFQLWVAGAPPASSSMAGRFASLLDEHDRRRLAGSYESDPELMVAQLSFPPRRMHNDAVTRTPPLLPWLLPIGEYPAHPFEADHVEVPGYLDLDDLAVTASATQFFLIHRPSGKRVHAHVLHALETTLYTPPLVRFLAELATARSAVFGPFDFGAARTLPFLPRIRYGRSVLAPARWLLRSEDLPGPKADSGHWQEALADWRCRWRVPAHVVLCEGEQRLPLDLDEPTQRSLLRTRLHRTSTLELRESGDPADQSWVGRACEFVVPLTAASRQQSEKPALQRDLPGTGNAGAGTTATSGPVLPGGSSLLLAQLEGNPQRFDDILSGHLPRLHARVQAETVNLWFRRHHDTTRPDADHYLQIFLRLASPEQYGTAAAHVAAWVNELREAGLVARFSFETAWLQGGKYGADIVTCEHLFAVDSTAALVEIALAQQAQLPIQAVAAVSMADLAAGLAPTPQRGWQWLTTALPQHHGSHDRGLREQTLQLAQHLGHPVHAAEQHYNQHESATLTAWSRRRDALITYRAHLDRDPATVLRALLHDHFIRTVAVDPEREQATNRLARAIALRAQALAHREGA